MKAGIGSIGQAAALAATGSDHVIGPGPEGLFLQSVKSPTGAIYGRTPSSP
jgi:hypothetical protein